MRIRWGEPSIGPVAEPAPGQRLRFSAAASLVRRDRHHVGVGGSDGHLHAKEPAQHPHHRLHLAATLQGNDLVRPTQFGFVVLEGLAGHPGNHGCGVEDHEVGHPPSNVDHRRCGDDLLQDESRSGRWCPRSGDGPASRLHRGPPPSGAPSTRRTPGARRSSCPHQHRRSQQSGRRRGRDEPPVGPASSSPCRRCP